MPAKPLFQRAPLLPSHFAPLPLQALRPAGWLRAQLRTAADALIDATLPENDLSIAIARASSALPLGYLTDNAALIKQAQASIEALLDAQREDGCLLPDAPHDWRLLADFLSVLMQYHTVTADKQILVRMLKGCRFLFEQLPTHPLTLAEAALAGNLLEPTLWLYTLTGKRFLLELARAVHAQDADWTAFCHTMPIKAPVAKQFAADALLAACADEGYDPRRYHSGLYQHAHALHIAHGLKTPALVAQWTGGIKHESAFDVGFAKLMKHHGVAYGCFTGDDLLAGHAPSQGTLNTAIPALMGTLKTLLAAQGQAVHGDLLEALAFNALPAAFSADMRTCQCVQQANQVLLSDAPRGFFHADGDANCFKPYCADTLALAGGWPGFASSLWMASRDGGLAAISYAPCQVRYPIGGSAVRIDVTGAYPFDGAVRIQLSLDQPASFPLHLRIPGWAQGATISIGDELIEAQPATFASLERTWHDGDALILTLPMPVRLAGDLHGHGAVLRGPMLFALAPDIAETDGALSAISDWAYALLPDAGFSVACDPAAAAPFGQGNAVVIDAIGIPMPEWRLQQHSAAPPPVAPRAGRALAKRLRLVPYGDTTLRISQFPLAQD